MDKIKFENAIQSLREYSIKIYRIYNDNLALVDQLNTLSKKGRSYFYKKYKDSTGPVKELRKEISGILNERNLELEELEAIIERAITSNPDKFNRFFKKWFNILYYFLVFDFKDDVKNKLKYVSDSITSELDGQNILKSKIVDFDGSRKNGNTMCWIALFNNRHKTQESAKQLFTLIENGRVEYSLYDHLDKKHFDKIETAPSETFSIDKFIEFFKKHLPVVQNDNEPNLSSDIINLSEDECIFKISMSERSIDDDDYEYLINKNVIAVGSQTKPIGGSNQSQGFTYTNQMKIGDYFYLCRGNKYIELLGKVSGNAVDCDVEELNIRGFKQRSFNIIQESNIKINYNEKSKRWTPNNNSTCVEIPSGEIPLANELIFTPTFNLKIMKENKVQLDKNEPFPSDYKHPLNQILYGPPGTGKTYKTILKAAEIIEEQQIDDYKKALEIFKTNLHDRIEFITFHQNYSYEDFIQGLRPDTENEKELTFERKNGVFKIIADKALKNLRDSKNPLTFKKPFEEVFNTFISPLVEEDKEIEVKMKKVSYHITSVSSKSISFRKASGGTAHTLSIATLKKMYEEESLAEIHGIGIYYAPLVDELLRIGKDSTGKKVEVKKKNYVIVIDEINRANISRVFGELITLIEEDKRSHGKIPMEAKLPSGDIFIVPSNLYIIGTMNTADKSIALLDIALRRRFEFEPMYPNYKIEGIYDLKILESLNEQIIMLKGHDFQIGHSYFMNENKDLVERMNKKVIPLLLEYFMNDKKEVEKILSNAGLLVEEGIWPLRITGKS